MILSKDYPCLFVYTFQTDWKIQFERQLNLLLKNGKKFSSVGNLQILINKYVQYCREQYLCNRISKNTLLNRFSYTNKT